MHRSLSYDDVLLVPQFSDIKSRSEVDLGSNLTNGLFLDTPIISSPMDTVTEEAMATVMAVEGGCGIIHRYNTIDQQAIMVSSVVQQVSDHVRLNIGAAVGVAGRNYFHHVVVHTAGKGFGTVRRVHILIGRILSDDASQKFELLFHRVVDTGLDRSHRLESALQQSKGCSDRRVGAHIRNVHITDRP